MYKIFKNRYKHKDNNNGWIYCEMRYKFQYDKYDI